MEALLGFVEQAQQVAEDKGCASLIAFATSAVRDASNVDEVLDTVRARRTVRTLDGLHDRDGVGAERGLVEPGRNFDPQRAAVQHLGRQGHR